MKSNLPAPHVEKLESDLAACDAEIDCETTLGDQRYLIVSLGDLRLGNEFELRSLQSVDAAAQPIQAVVVKVFLIVGSVVLLGGVVLSWVVSRSVVRPLTALVHDTKRRLVSHKKDYSIRAAQHGEDEMRALVGAFDEMLVHIENHETDLQSQVEARTVQLTATNADLRKAKDKAEEGTRLKSQFLANMSHEIRTPMNVILGMTELAQDTVSNAQQGKYLRMVQEAGESLLTIINDVLDFSKVESGRIELQNSEFKVRDTLAKTVELLGLKAGQKGLNLAWDVRSAVPNSVIGDEGRLQQVLVNLVSNAIKFTADGDVLVRAELEDGNETSIHFTVTDTGVGVPADKQGVIFEPFRQVDGSLTRRFGGTGLGLAIAGQLVEAMGGRMWLHSEVRKGSAFHFTAPFTQPERGASRESAPGSPRVVVPIRAGRQTHALSRLRTEDNPSLRGLRVLVAEDDSANQVLVTGLLSNWECSVVLASDGIEAIRACKQDQFDVVLMDLQMPKLDGFAATSALRKWERKSRKRIPIIALTAHALKGNREMCLKAGMDDFVTKPIRRKLLREAIDRVLSNRESTTNESNAPVGLEASRSTRYSPPQPTEPVAPREFSTRGAS